MAKLVIEVNIIIKALLIVKEITSKRINKEERD
jgi:hypothetical protein